MDAALRIKPARADHVIHVVAGNKIRDACKPPTGMKNTRLAHAKLKQRVEVSYGKSFLHSQDKKNKYVDAKIFAVMYLKNILRCCHFVKKKIQKNKLIKKQK